MGNDNSTTPTSERQLETGRSGHPTQGPDPTLVYNENSNLLYGVVAWFLPEEQIADSLQEIAQRLVTSVPLSGYRKYSRLVCLRAVFENLQKNQKARALNRLSFEETFCLLLRDLYEIDCADIGAIAGASEGSIRTRLERARLKFFAKPTDTEEGEPVPLSRVAKRPKLALSSSQHFCIRVKDAIEDWDTGLTQGTTATEAPPDVVKNIGTCRKCRAVLDARLSSLEYFKTLKFEVAPEKYRQFPVSPLLVKEGKQLLVNWAAAPWYVKALFEGLLATTLVLGVVLSIPRIKSVYEFWLERRIDLYSVAELASGLGNSNDVTTDISSTAPPAENAADPQRAAGPGIALTVDGNALLTASTDPTVNKSQLPEGQSPSKSEPLSVKPESEFIGRDSEAASADRVYRVLVKTDAPEIIKEQVNRALINAQFVAADDSATASSNLTGGVMFDVFVPVKAYKTLINEVAKLGETKVIITRSKERGRPGKVRLKLWLQRI